MSVSLPEQGGRLRNLSSRHWRLSLLIPLAMAAQISLAQMSENLSTDPEGADTFIEQAFRPYFFTPTEETTQSIIPVRNWPRTATKIYRSAYSAI